MSTDLEKVLIDLNIFLLLYIAKKYVQIKKYLFEVGIPFVYVNMISQIQITIFALYQTTVVRLIKLLILVLNKL